jgi:hypothetical protein
VRWFFSKSKGRVTENLDARELEILERELEESARKAMPSLVDDSFASGGPSYNNVNPVSQVINGRGFAAIGLRRLWEPRSRWRPEDKSEL